jgi:hypothetical protein
VLARRDQENSTAPPQAAVDGRRGSIAPPYSGNQFSAWRVVVPAIGIPPTMLVVRLPGLKVLLPSPGGPLPPTGLYALPSTILATRLASASIAAFFSST